MGAPRGYRDDHAAALEQVAVLERELADSDEKLEDKEQELARLRRRIVDLERAMASGESLEDETPAPEAPRPFERVMPTAAGYSEGEADSSSWKDIVFFPFQFDYFAWETSEWPGKLFTVGMTVFLIALIVSSVSDCLSRRAMDHRATARWKGEVTMSRGNRISVGAACTVKASLASDRKEAFGPEGLTVTCGDQQVYDWKARAQLISGDDAPRPLQRCSNLRQMKASAQMHRYQLSCADVKGRTGGRPEMSLETSSGQLMIWSDTPSIFRLELKVQPWSDLVSGAPLLAGNKGTQPGYW